MLAAGGTKHHSELLAPFGLDARDPSFWQGGLSVIERMIGELEALDGEGDDDRTTAAALLRIASLPDCQ